MNYKEMLDTFEFLEKKLAHLELENRYLKERVQKLESAQWFQKPAGPGFTPGTLPSPHTWPQPNTVWCRSEHTNSQFGDH